MVGARYRAMILPTLTCGALVLTVLFRGGPEAGVEWWVLVGLLSLMWVVLYVGGVFFAGAPRR
jgi:Ca2+/H+ antiporter